MNEENTNVTDVQAEATYEIEQEERQNQSGGAGKAVALGAAVTACVIGAGYGLFRLGKKVVAKINEQQAEKDLLTDEELDELEDEVENLEVNEKVVEEPKKKN